MAAAYIIGLILLAILCGDPVAILGAVMGALGIFIAKASAGQTIGVVGIAMSVVGSLIAGLALIKLGGAIA